MHHPNEPELVEWSMQNDLPVLTDEGFRMLDEADSLGPQYIQALGETIDRQADALRIQYGFLPTRFPA